VKSSSCLLFIITTLFSINTYASSVDRLERKYGIEISFDARQASALLSTPTESATQAQRDIMLPLLERFLKCYKPRFLKQNLRKIFMVGVLSLDGVSVGGSYSPYHKIIVLGAWHELTYFAHHEFSSLLMRVLPLDRQAWYRYNGAPYTNWTDFRKMKKNHRLRQLGFYYDYSQVSFEEDFNVLAGMALAKPHLTAEAIKPYSRLQGKLAIVKRFYKNIFTCSL